MKEILFMIALVFRSRCATAFSRNANSIRSLNSIRKVSITYATASGRPYRPHLDSYDDEGFGAYEYEPDIAEMEEMIRQEELWMQRSAPKVTQTAAPPKALAISSTPQGAPPPVKSTPPRASPVISMPSSQQKQQQQPQQSTQTPFQNRTNLPVYDFFTFQSEYQNQQQKQQQQEEDEQRPSTHTQEPVHIQQPSVKEPMSNEPVDVLDFLHDLGAQMSRDPLATLPSAVSPASSDASSPPTNIPTPSVGSWDENSDSSFVDPFEALKSITSTTITSTPSTEKPASSATSSPPSASSSVPMPPQPPPSVATLDKSMDDSFGDPFEAMQSTTSTRSTPSIVKPTSSAASPASIPTPSSSLSTLSQAPAPPRPRPPPPPSAFSSPEKRAFFAKASSGSGISSPVDVLEKELEQITQQVYQQNNHEPFNINSPMQVSIAVFGVPGESTNKEALEAKASTGSRMADLILQYRRLQQRIRRQSSKQQAVQQGTRVKSAMQSISKSSSVPTGDNPLLLVDASAYIYRAYYSMPPIHRYDGMPTGAVMGFCNMLNRLILNRMVQGEQPRVVLVFDAKGKTFRHQLYNEYKAHRAEAPMDLIPQFNLVRQAGLAYGIPMIEALNYEADDVIATLTCMAQQEGLDTHILSGDKDLMQLICDDGPAIVHMIDPMKMERVTSARVMERWNVTPEQLGDVLALAGDSADNVPGVPGIGPKIAADLLREFGSLEYLLDHLDEVRQPSRRSKLETYMDQARLSKALVTLERAIPIEAMTFPVGQRHVSDLRMEPMNEKRIVRFYEEMGFRDLKQRFMARLEGVQRTRRPPNPRRSFVSKVQVPIPDDFRDVPF